MIKMFIDKGFLLSMITKMIEAEKKSYKLIGFSRHIMIFLKLYKWLVYKVILNT